MAVRATSAVAGDPDAVDLDRLRSLATLARGDTGREYIALSDGWRRLRLDVIAGSIAGSNWVRFDYGLSGFVDLELRLETLRRLARLRRDGGFDHKCYPVPPGLARRIEALQVADGLSAGASYRDVALALFGEARVRTDWRTRSDYLLSRVRRRAAEAAKMLAGGYRLLLRERQVRS